MKKLSFQAVIVSALASVLCAFFIYPTDASAQAAATASIVGAVKDESGAVVPDATVTITNVQTQLVQTTKSDAQGFYRLPLLPIGRYQLEVSMPGFQRYVQKDLTLAVNNYLTIDIALRVGAPTDSVTVDAAAPLLETQTGTIRGVVDQQRMLELPLNGRNVVDLLGIGSGVISRGGSQGEGWVFSVNGSRNTGVYYQMDSGYNTDSYRNQSGLFPNPDAVQEFSLQKANFSAEYGNATGAVVNVITKSGTNEFHGAAYEFLRNGALNARNFFAAQRDSLKRNQFGGTLGGPILKDKLFFFGSYEGTTLRSDPNLTLLYLPTAAMRKGDFSAVTKAILDPTTGKAFPGNQIPVSRFNPVTTAWLPYFKDPGTADGHMYTGLPTTQRTDEYLGKIDFNQGNHRASAKYFRTVLNQPAVFDPQNLAITASRLNYYPYNQLSLNYLYTFSPTLINNATFAYRWRESLLDPTGMTMPMDWVKAGIKNLAYHPPEFNLAISGYFSTGLGQFYDKNDKDFHFSDSLTRIRGRHEIRLGGDLLRSTNNIVNHFQTMGQFTFNGNITGNAMSDFFLGYLYSFLQGGGEYKDLYGGRYGFYVQDNYRIRPELTLNLGLRWDPMLPYQDTLGRVECYSPGAKSTRFPNAPLGYVFAGDSACPGGGYDSHVALFAPRFGFAWRAHNTKWIFRGGFGLFWNPEMTVNLNRFVDAAPFSPTVSLFGVKADDPYAGIVNPFPASFAPFIPPTNVTFLTPLGGVISFPPDFKPNYTETYNLTLERELAPNWVARASYVGNLGRRLSYAEDINYARYVAGQSSTANIQQRRPLKDYASLIMQYPGSTSNYHGMQLSVERRMSSNLSFEANYTWAKSIDEYSSDYGPGDGSVLNVPGNRSANRGLSDFDLPYRFVLSYVWSLPRLSTQSALVRHVFGGWQSSGIWSMQSGTPFSVSSGTDRALSGINRDFADLVGNPYLDTGRPRSDLIAQYFNRSAFTAAALGTFGTSPRNTLRGPGSMRFDTALMKTFSAGDRFKIHLRLEAFNAFNKPNFSNPGATVSSSSTFGKITSAGDPRIVQVALRLSF